LYLWVIFSDLSKECKSADTYESLFSCNKIEFRKADDYSLVQSDGYSVSHISDADDEDLTRSVHKSRSWRLSTDAFSASWDIVIFVATQTITSIKASSRLCYILNWS
jgi:hypothetical protein